MWTIPGNGLSSVGLPAQSNTPNGTGICQERTYTSHTCRENGRNGKWTKLNVRVLSMAGIGKTDTMTTTLAVIAMVLIKKSRSITLLNWFGSQPMRWAALKHTMAPKLWLSARIGPQVISNTSGQQMYQKVIQISYLILICVEIIKLYIFI